MSLDVYLTLAGHESQSCGSGIFVRENGQTKEISREEWDEKFPGREPVTATVDKSETVYEANITHNLGQMAEAAGVYKALWRPEEIGVTRASQLVPLLRGGLSQLESDPAYFRKFNPANGWGTYDGLVKFVRRYLEACEEYPDAEVYVSR